LLITGIFAFPIAPHMSVEAILDSSQGVTIVWIALTLAQVGGAN
jgi:hypothetical protein